MREYIVLTLFLLSVLPARAEAVPPGWKVIKDPKGECRIAVPPEWVPYSEHGGTAVFRDATTAIAVVTSQPGQLFKPMPASMVKIINIPKERMFENSAKRLFYQDRISRGPDDPNAFVSSVPAKDGTCSSRVAIIPAVNEEVAKKITLTLGPVPEEGP